MLTSLLFINLEAVVYSRECTLPDIRKGTLFTRPARYLVILLLLSRQGETFADIQVKSLIL